MSVQLILKNSSVEDKRPSANQLANGEISLNYNEAGAFLCCRDTSGAVQQIGGVKISDTAPDSPVNQSQWFDPTSLTLFIYDGGNWLPIAGGGGGGGGTGGISTVIGNEGIDASTIAGVVTLNVELAGGQDGLEFKASKLSASIAGTSTLGSIKVGSGLDVANDGTLSVLGGDALQPDEVLAGDGITVTPGINTVEVSVNLADISGLEFSSDELTAKLGAGLQFDADGAIEATGGGGSGDAFDPTDVVGKDGIAVQAVAGKAEVSVDLAGGQDGLETVGEKLTASIATETVLGSVKIGDGIDRKADGTISVPDTPIVPPVISTDIAPAFVEDYIWFDTRTAEAYVGYKDTDDDEYWISLTKVGAPGAKGDKGDKGEKGDPGTGGGTAGNFLSLDANAGPQEVESTDLVQFYGDVSSNGKGYFLEIDSVTSGTFGGTGYFGGAVELPGIQFWGSGSSNTISGEGIYIESTDALGYLNLSANKTILLDAKGTESFIRFKGNWGAQSYRFQRDGSTDEGLLDFQSLSGDRTFTYPDKDGTLALLDDAGATISTDPPASPTDGAIWVKDTTGKSYAWWGSQSVWVSM